MQTPEYLDGFAEWERATRYGYTPSMDGRTDDWRAGYASAVRASCAGSRPVAPGPRPATTSRTPVDPRDRYDTHAAAVRAYGRRR